MDDINVVDPVESATALKHESKLMYGKDSI